MHARGTDRVLYWDMSTRTYTEQEMDRAESLYVALATTQLQTRVDELVQMYAKHPVLNKFQTRQLKQAKDALRAAQDAARAAFSVGIAGL